MTAYELESMKSKSLLNVHIIFNIEPSITIEREHAANPFEPFQYGTRPVRTSATRKVHDGPYPYV